MSPQPFHLPGRQQRHLHHRACVRDVATPLGRESGRHRAVLGLVVALAVAVPLTIAVAGDGPLPGGLDEPLTTVTRGYVLRSVDWQ